MSRPYTDDELDRAAHALRVAVVDPDWAGGITNTARAVLDAVAADIARRERERYEALGGWVYVGDDPYDYRFHYEDEEPELGYPTSPLFQLRADAIEANADPEDDR